MKNGLKYVFEAVITESQMICSCMQLNYATGCTEHCFLSLPFLSKRTIPSTNANNVSSPPRPDLQGIVIVGDIDVDTVEAKLKAVFADVQKPVNPAERTYYPVTDNKEPIVAIGTDKEVDDPSIEIYFKQDATILYIWKKRSLRLWRTRSHRSASLTQE